MSDTLPRLITDVSSFEVRCAIGQFVMDGPDSDHGPDLAAMGGKVTIAPDLKKPLRVRGDTPLEDRVVGVNALVFTLDPVTGQLVHPDGTVGVELIDPDDDRLDPKGWTYTATVAPTEGNRWSVTFGGPGDGDRVVNIGALAGVEISPGQGANVVQQVVTARDESTTAALTASTAAIEASTAAGDAAASATYAAEVAYGQPLEATDTIFAGLVATGAATTAALDRTYRAHVSVKEYGAIGDGTTDDTTAVQAALTAGAGGSVYFPPGTYRLTGNLLATDGTDVSGGGAGTTVLDWSGKGAYSADALMRWSPGTLTDSTLLAADAAPGDGTLTVPEGHPFETGDIVRITADEVLFGEMVKAEFQRVLTAEAGVLTLSGPVFDSYSRALGARVERANLTTGSLSGVTFRGQGVNPGGYGDNAVHFALAQNVRVTDVRFRHIENKCILADSVFGLNVDRADFLFATSRTPLQYGVAVAGASQMVMLSGMSSMNDRHMVTTSTSQSLAAHSTGGRGIPRVITVTGCTALGSWQAPIDTHRGGEYITVVGNSLNTESTGVKIRGKHSLVTGNVIVGKRVSATGAPCGVRIGMLCEDVQITGNMIRGFTDGVRIDTPDGTTRALVVSENTILDCTQGVYVTGALTVDGVRIAGNTIRANADGYPVYLVASINDLDIQGNVLAGGLTAVYCASSTALIRRATVQANTIRGQSSYGMFLRGLSDALVTSNLSPASEIRFAGVCERVTTGMNMATISDLSTPGVTQK